MTIRLRRLRATVRRVAPRSWLAARRGPAFEDVERDERRFYEDTVQSGMTVFDVGANVGELSVLFARLADPGMVHAFEANPGLTTRLELRIETGGHRNVVVNALALSDGPGAVSLNCYDPPFEAFSTAAVRELGEHGVDPAAMHTRTVAATTIDGYCAVRGIASIDLLKIDVEGAELQVMRGAETMLAERRIGCVVFEYGTATYDMGNSATAIRRLLDGHRYRIAPLGRCAPFPDRDDAARAGFAMYVARP